MTNNVTTTATDDLVITRTFDAPPEFIWKMWTEPEHLMRWWGPESFTSPECQMDLRVGGKYVFCMQSPEGDKFYSTGTFKEITPYKKLVFTDSFSDKDGNIVSGAEYGMGDDFPNDLEVTVTFEDLDGKTRMTMTEKGLTSKYFDRGVVEGWDTSFDKLADYIREA